MNHCIRHFEEPVGGVCRTCHNTFCDRCLVYAFGPGKPPFCVGCALDASGVRNGGRHSRRQPAATEIGDPSAPAGATTALDRRTARAERRAAKASARAARKVRPVDPVPIVADAPDLTPRQTFVPRPGELAGTNRYDAAAADQLV